jgi:hypothetical protein
MSLSTAGVTNIGEKLTVGIVETGGKFTASVTAIVSATQGKDVTTDLKMALVVHLALQISLQIFVKSSKWRSGARGKMINEIKPEVKIFMTLSL